MKKIIYYRVLDHCEDSYYETSTHWDNLKEEGRFAVQDAADNYHSEHDGWECDWPLIFSLHESEDGPEICRFSVNRAPEPVFSASPIDV